MAAAAQAARKHRKCPSAATVERHPSTTFFFLSPFCLFCLLISLSRSLALSLKRVAAGHEIQIRFEREEIGLKT